MHDFWIVVLSSVGIGVAAGYLGGSINAWGTRRAIRELQLDVASLHSDLVREAKKRGALARWDRDSEGKESPTDEQIEQLRDLVVGEERHGFTRGKEGGVFRGPR